MESELHLLDKQREDVILSDAKTRCLYCLMKNKELTDILSAKFWPMPIILKRAIIGRLNQLTD